MSARTVALAAWALCAFGPINVSGQGGRERDSASDAVLLAVAEQLAKSFAASKVAIDPHFAGARHTITGGEMAARFSAELARAFENGRSRSRDELIKCGSSAADCELQDVDVAIRFGRPQFEAGNAVVDVDITRAKTTGRGKIYTVVEQFILQGSGANWRVVSRRAIISS